MRKLTARILTLTIALLTVFAYSAYAVDIGDYITTETVAKGITRTNIRRLTTTGWLNFEVMKIDLNDPDVSLQLLTGAGGVNHASNVLDMAAANDSDVAINTDFFQRSSLNSALVSPIGTVMKDGKLLSSPSDDTSFATFSLSKDRVAMFDYWTCYLGITAPNGNSYGIKYINKYNDAGDGIVLYNREWDTMSPGTQAPNAYEVLVVDNVVQAIYWDNPPVEIPENGYVLTCWLDRNTFIKDNLAVGDTVKLDVYTTPDWNAIDVASGGGTLLLKNGERAPNTHNVSGLQPRTAVGSDQSGKIIYFVTVDGRQAVSRGTTMDEMANFLLSIGCYNAINMDGGGSTTMVARDLTSGELRTLNHPSDGPLRTVAIGLGARNTKPATGILGTLEIAPESPNVFLGASCFLDLKAFDTSYRPMNVPEDITWKVVEGEGRFENNRFYPGAAGKAVVSATCGDVTGTYELNVLSELAYLEISPKYLEITSESGGWVKLTGKDPSGLSAPVILTDTDFSFSNDIASAGSFDIAPHASGTTVLSATFNGKTAYSRIVIDGKDDPNVSLPENSRMSDAANQPVQNTDSNFTFSVFGHSVEKKSLLSLFLYNKLVYNINQNTDFCTFVGGFPQEQKNQLNKDKLSAGGYGVDVINDNTFIRINTSGGGIYSTHADQWNWMITDFPNVWTKNVFILLPSSINEDNFTDRTEWKIFQDKLDEFFVQKGRNVYVFYSEYDTKSYNFDIVNGVRYFGIRGFNDTSYGAMMSNARNAGYLAVSVEGDRVTYEYKNLL